MRVTANGNVGIGTATPVQELTVVGDIRAGAGPTNHIQIGHGGAHAYVAHTGAGTLAFRTGGNQLADTQMSIDDATGNVHIVNNLHIGFHKKVCPYPTGDTFGNCSCNPGEVVISGGTSTLPNSTRAIRVSRPVNLNTWRVACTDIATATRVDCGPIEIMCARLAPDP